MEVAVPFLHHLIAIQIVLMSGQASAGDLANGIELRHTHNYTTDFLDITKDMVGAFIAEC